MYIAVSILARYFMHTWSGCVPMTILLCSERKNVGALPPHQKICSSPNKAVIFTGVIHRIFCGRWLLTFSRRAADKYYVIRSKSDYYPKRDNLLLERAGCVFVISMINFCLFWYRKWVSQFSYDWQTTVKQLILIFIRCQLISHLCVGYTWKIVCHRPVKITEIEGTLFVEN